MFSPPTSNASFFWRTSLLFTDQRTENAEQGRIQGAWQRNIIPSSPWEWKGRAPAQRTALTKKPNGQLGYPAIIINIVGV